MCAAEIRIHTSDRTKFKKCRLEWYFSSILQLGYRPAIAELPLGFGASIHSGTEVYKDPRLAKAPEEVRQSAAIASFLAAWKSMRCNQDGIVIAGFEEEYYQYKDLGVGMLRNWFDWDTRTNTNKVIAVEIPFKIPITGLETVFYYGKIDCLEEDENGYWIKDYKTVGRWTDEEALYAYLQRDDQTAGYCYAIRKALGLNVQGVIYEQLYKAVPLPPVQLQRPYKGRLLSTNRNQTTTYELFLRAIEQTGESTVLYADYLEFLRDNAPQFFRRIEVRKTAEELEYVEQQIYKEAKAMIDPNVDIYPTPSYFGCRFCSYKAPCEETMRGGNPQATLAMTFMKTGEHYVDYASRSLVTD
jgi:ATP-dependent helicase/DNAse subunit B